MRVYLVRHGKAQRPEEASGDDVRTLVGIGQTQARWLSAGIARLIEREGAEAKPVVVVSSPIVRARQTAELIADGLGLTMELSGKLSTACGLTELFDELDYRVQQAHELGGAVMLVGHNPTMEDAGARLLGKAGLSMGTGEALVIELPAGWAGEVGAGRLAAHLSMER